MAGDDLFKILAEVFVESHCRVPLFGFAKDFGDWPPAAILCPDDGDGPVILLDDDLDALLHPGQHGMEIASHLGVFSGPVPHAVTRGLMHRRILNRLMGNR